VIALVSAVLPVFSGFVAKDDMESLRKTIVFCLKNVFFIMAPMTVIIFILASPIIRILFQGGEFTQYSTGITSSALMFYSLGLISFGGIKVLVAVFHSLQDTKTPVKIAAGCLLINAILSFSLMIPMGIGGIALGSAIASLIDVLFLFFILDKRLGGIKKEFPRFLIKTSIATAITAAFIFLSWRNLVFSNEIIKLVFVMITGLVFYQGVCLVLRIEPAQKIVQWIKERL